MNALDIDDLLDKNPQVDQEVIKRHQKLVVDKDKSPNQRDAVPSPFGKRQQKKGDESWDGPKGGLYRPHYRGVF